MNSENEEMQKQPQGPASAESVHNQVGEIMQQHQNLVTATKGNMSTSSMVLGIVGVPACFLFVPSILALIFGWITLSRMKSGAISVIGRAQAIAGVVLGSVAIIGGILVWVFLAVPGIRQIQKCEDDFFDLSTRDQIECIDDGHYPGFRSYLNNSRLDSNRSL